MQENTFQRNETDLYHMGRACGTNNIKLVCYRESMLLPEIKARGECQKVVLWARFLKCSYIET